MHPYFKGNISVKMHAVPLGPDLRQHFPGKSVSYISENMGFFHVLQMHKEFQRHNHCYVDCIIIAVM
jgi:hypothetical protein